MTTPREQIDEHLSLVQKQQVVVGIIRWRLVQLGFAVAEPVPASTEALWFSNFIDPATGSQAPPLYRAALKTASSFDDRPTIETKVYTINIDAEFLEYSMLQTHYVYFIGLRNPGVEAIGYHIGCLPARFFAEPYRNGSVRVGNKGGGRRTATLHFHVLDNGAVTFRGKRSSDGSKFEPDISKYFRRMSDGIVESRAPYIQAEG